MAAEQSDEPKPLQPAPRTEPGELPVYPRDTRWPKALGIISIILGVLGILAGFIGASAGLIVKTLQAMVEDKGAVDWNAVSRAVTWLARISLVSAILAVVLLVVGVGLVRRRAWAIPLGKTWAVLQIIVAILGTGMSHMIQRSIAEAIQQAGTTGRMPIGTSPAATAWSLLWGCALPVFMLIWFARREIREEVAAWR
jgi:hypothetical protein